MQHTFNSSRRGFTLLELLIVVAMIGLLAVISLKKSSNMVTGWRVNRAAQSMSEELQSGFALVGRNRKPLMITLDTVNMELRLSDRAGVTYRKKNYGSSSAYRLSSRQITASRLAVEVFPPGLAADSLSITIAVNGSRQRIRMLRGGLVQICAPSTGVSNSCL